MAKIRRQMRLLILLLVICSILFVGIPMLLFFLWLHVPYSYKGDYPDLYTVAVNNFFGCNGYIANETPSIPTSTSSRRTAMAACSLHTTSG